MNREETIILISRLFTAYGKTPNEAQIDEWVKAQARFKFRADETSAAIDSLINTSNRMPTISELRTAVMSVRAQRASTEGAPAPKPSWLIKAEADWKREDFEWWHQRFGSLAPQARALIVQSVVIPNTAIKDKNGDLCSRGNARLAGTIARAINEMHRDNLPFTDRWERLKELTSGNTFTITPPAQVAASAFEDF